MKSIVFVVPSVIEFTESPLSYSSTRSIFSAQQRAHQTLQTIESIRLKVPDAEILLVEMGLQHAPQCIKQLVNHYLYLGSRGLVREAVDGIYKGYGEVVGLLLANHVLHRLDADYYFKISGRYYLNDDFDIARWGSGIFDCKEGPGWISTRLYGFPAKIYESWRRTLKQAIPFLLEGEAIENTLWRLLPDIHAIGPIGVSGKVAPWNEDVSE